MTTGSCTIVVLISGNGSNLQALIDASAKSDFTISAVISNKADAFGLERAERAGIPALVVDHNDYPDRESFDRRLIAEIDAFNPQLVVLAGFMRILSAQFVQHFAGRILNIHPSLLPDYRGTHTHERVLAAGEKEHGVSVHFVTEELDGGPVVMHAVISIETTDTSVTLAAKVAGREHIIYPKVVSLFAAGRLRMQDNAVWFDNEPLGISGIRDYAP